jgi:hypothetical protein
MTANGRPYQPQGWTSIVDTVAVRPKGGGADSLWVQIPMDLEPGHHLMKFRLRAGITQMDIGHGPTGFAAGGLLRAYDKWPATLWETTVEYAQSIEVLPASARDR